jgi:diaminopimelate epimerase
VSGLAFAKYQAAGNDFLLVEDLDDAVMVDADDAAALCDRWVGVGADGVIRVVKDADGTFRFVLTNADGSSAETSGNGLRCFGAYLHDRRLADGSTFEVRTAAGPRTVALSLAGARAEAATVSMGSPGFTKGQIPMMGPAWESFLEQPFDLGGGLQVTASALSMGNPHLVLFVEEDPERYHVEHIGPALERDERFPERTNVEFARVGPGGIDVRVWERGVGETLACGTGACAVAVAANEGGRAPATVTVRFRGGDLHVKRRADGEVMLGGPVAHVFDGVVDLERLRAGLDRARS